MKWNYWGNFNSSINIPVLLFLLLLFSQIRHGSKLPQTVGRLQCSSLLCWRTHRSYPAIDQEVISHQRQTLIRRAGILEWYTVTLFYTHCIIKLYVVCRHNERLSHGTRSNSCLQRRPCSTFPILNCPGISIHSTWVWVVLGWVKEQAVYQVEGCARYCNVTDCLHKCMNNI